MTLKEQWQGLGQELGFEFKEGIKVFLESPTLLRITEQQGIPKDIDFLNNPLLQKMFASVFMGALTGSVGGYEFCILKSGKGSPDTGYDASYVSVVLFFKQPMESGFEIHRASFRSRLGKLLFPFLYINIQDQELGRLIAAKARNNMEKQALLADARVREKLIKLYKYSPEFVIEDFGIRYEIPGTIIDKSSAEEVMKLMSEVASVLT